MPIGHQESIIGLPIQNYTPETGLTDPTSVAYRVGTYYNQYNLDALFKALHDEPQLSELRALVIGFWGVDGEYDVPAMLLEIAPKLPNLEALFVGDISYDENEMSWIEQFDLGAVVNAFPTLKYFQANGGQDLRLTGLAHERLETLLLITGGMSAEVVEDVLTAPLPKLRTLELWTGADEYGASVTIDDLMPILVGTTYPTTSYPFPELTRLKLPNSELADEIAQTLAQSPVLARLEHLDLSQGLLSNQGLAALAASPHLSSLKSLHIDYSYVNDDDLIERIRAQGVEVSADDLKDPDEDDYWYVELSE
jgi:hypothetical protein